MPKTNYGAWIQRSEPTAAERAAMRRQVAGFEYAPRIGLALVVSDADEVWIKSSADSVLSQLYPYLELCVLDNGSERPHVREVLEDYAAGERVRVRRLPEKTSRAGAYNAAIRMTTGEYVALLEEGDELAPDALFRVAELLQGVGADVIYTDEDGIDLSGERLDPAFKPFWSLDLSLSSDYVGRLCVMRRELLDGVGGFREGFEGAEEHDLILRLSEKTDRIHHLPGVLYHNRMLPGLPGLPGGPEPDGAHNEAVSRAIEEALARRGEDATVEPAKGSSRVVRRVAGTPKVSVIVSAPEGTNRAPVIGELKQQTSLPVHQILVASGGRRVDPTVDHATHPFPARALNLAAGRADGEYLAFLAAGARTTDPGWLPELLAHAQRPEVGAVGCALLNPDGGPRTGGSLVDLSGLVGRSGESEGEGPPPLVDGPFNPLAVSAECVVVRKAVFEEVGGFDDERLPTAFYDLDLSFRLREKGLLNVHTPHASLVYGGAAPVPGEEEIAYMWRRWWEQLVRLLYYRWPPFTS